MSEETETETSVKKKGKHTKNARNAKNSKTNKNVRLRENHRSGERSRRSDCIIMRKIDG